MGTCVSTRLCLSVFWIHTYFHSGTKENREYNFKADFTGSKDLLGLYPEEHEYSESSARSMPKPVWHCFWEKVTHHSLAAPDAVRPPIGRDILYIKS